MIRVKRQSLSRDTTPITKSLDATQAQLGLYFRSGDLTILKRDEDRKFLRVDGNENVLFSFGWF